MKSVTSFLYQTEFHKAFESLSDNCGFNVNLRFFKNYIGFFYISLKSISKNFKTIYRLILK